MGAHTIGLSSLTSATALHNGRRRSRVESIGRSPRQLLDRSTRRPTSGLCVLGFDRLDPVRLVDSRGISNRRMLWGWVPLGSAALALAISWLVHMGPYVHTTGGHVLCGTCLRGFFFCVYDLAAEGNSDRFLAYSICDSNHNSGHGHRQAASTHVFSDLSFHPPRRCKGPPGARERAAGGGLWAAQRAKPLW